MESSTHSTKKSRKPAYTKIAIQSAVVLVVVGISFYGGIAYQKTKTPASGVDTATLDKNDSFGGPNGGFRTKISSSQVTAVSATSITVQTDDGTSKTYTINSSTNISKDRQSATTSDISVGDSVVVITDSSDATVASRIIDGVMMSQGSPPTDQGAYSTN